MGRVKRLLGVTAAGLLGSAGLVLATAGPAAATPNLCTIASHNIDYVAGYSWTQCTAGSGWFRVAVSCRVDPSDNLTYLYYGPWVSVQDAYLNGTISLRGCASSTPYIVGASTQFA